MNKLDRRFKSARTAAGWLIFLSSYGVIYQIKDLPYNEEGLFMFFFLIGLWILFLWRSLRLRKCGSFENASYLFLYLFGIVCLDAGCFFEGEEYWRAFFHLGIFSIILFYLGRYIKALYNHAKERADVSNSG